MTDSDLKLLLGVIQILAGKPYPLADPQVNDPALVRALGQIADIAASALVSLKEEKR